MLSDRGKEERVLPGLKIKYTYTVFIVVNIPLTK